MSKKASLKDILVENSMYKNTHRIKLKLINEGIFKEKCVSCGIGNEWNGEKLSLQLDHKNGVNNDHRIENLRLLCPNCHSQTKTYAGKARKGKKNPVTKKVFHKCKKCLKQLNCKNKNMLCRNCYNLYGRKSKRPPLEDLVTYYESMTLKEIGKIYDVSDRTIINWFRYYNYNYT